METGAPGLMENTSNAVSQDLRYPGTGNTLPAAEHAVGPVSCQDSSLSESLSDVNFFQASTDTHPRSKGSCGGPKARSFDKLGMHF